MPQTQPKGCIMADAIFRVIREKVGGETIRILLEPYKDFQKVALHDGDEFVTGTLNTDPWANPNE